VVASDATEFVPERGGLRALASASASCRGCGLYRDATQTVFGDGPAHARVLMYGEQPGDREDVEGAPFVGPAGGMLDRALVDAGIDRSTVYLTNAVKHFKFTPAERGKRRIHKTPSRTEVVACRPWLLAELRVVAPDVVVALGATAAKALMGNDFRVTRQRGAVLDVPDGFGHGRFVASVHPSSVLRSRDRDADYRAFVADLRAVAALL
jgi:uracil-DNA glycosylase